MKVVCDKKISMDYIVVPVFQDNAGDFLVEQLPEEWKALIQEKAVCLKEQGTGSSKKCFFEGKEIVFVNSGKQALQESVRTAATTAFECAKADCRSRMAIDYRNIGFEMEEEDLLYFTADTLLTADYSYCEFKKEKKRKLEEVEVVFKTVSDRQEQLLAEVVAVIEQVNLVRDLVNAPANIMTIQKLEEIARETAEKNGLSIRVYDKEELKEKGMNLILAVGQGSAQEPRLIEISYEPFPGLPKNFVVGKGIVFDTGGLNLKPGDSMLGMKTDMAGAATALGIVNAAASLKLKRSITALIPLAENSIGSGAIHPGDIIVGYKGKSVEVKNTDAEGRLILADALAYADEQNPELILDLATLTGAAIVALGSKITAGFFTDQEVKEKFFRAAKRCSELIWELPLVEEYRGNMKSKLADLSNLGFPLREAGTITAALFLQEFVENAKWVHLDIAGPSHFEGNWKYYPEGATGIMLKSVVEYFAN